VQLATPEPTPQSTRKPANAPTLRPKIINEGTPNDVAERHARILLKWLLKSLDGQADRMQTSKTVQLEYDEMCHAYGIAKRPWNTVGKYLARLTREKRRPLKLYQTWIDHTGRERSERVYRIPLDQ
jgi:hypothetical protein